MKRVLTLTLLVDRDGHQPLRYTVRVFQTESGFSVIRRWPNGEDESPDLHYHTSSLPIAIQHAKAALIGMPTVHI